MAKTKNTKNEEILKDINLEEVETDLEIDVEETEITKEEQLQKQLIEAQDKELRLRAEFDNYKRRTTVDLLNASSKGKVEVFKGILDTVDNLERALAHESTDESYAAGIKLVYDKMIEKLQSLGLEEIDCEGLMDHNIHQAVVTDTVDGLEEDEIIEVLQKGYKMDETIIRVAMVKVNKI